MSEINKALAELASQKKQPTQLQRAVLPKVSSANPILWIATGFALSLVVGGWAITQSQPEGQIVRAPITTVTTVQANEVSLVSPTQKVLSATSESVVVSQPAVFTDVTTNSPKMAAEKSVIRQVPTKVTTTSTKESIVVAKTDVPAKRQTTESHTHSSSAVTSGNQVSAPVSSESEGMVIEQVELSKEQLAEKAIGRAEKALDANNLQNALSAYSEALRHTPNNEVVRRKLAALYFGKGDSRKAYELLQAGIALDPEGETLRIALSKMLIKANQNEAALSPLVAIYDHSGKEYIAMRAALAQKLKKDDIALESYQRLSKMDSENARWWLGLAIQQERALDFKSAQNSYQAALSKVGISNQSQRFIKDRLALLQNLESAQ